MDRSSIFIIDNESSSTYEFDETLPPLPLPDLDDTLSQYFESLKPFGNEDELENSRQIITTFKNEIGRKLQETLVQRASNRRNWLEEWWSKYAYFTGRAPLMPYVSMAMPLKLDVINIPETHAYQLKSMARVMYHSIEYWDLLRKGKLKPSSSANGKLKNSSVQHKQFYSTARIPGEIFDHIEKHFLTESEGLTPTHGIITGKGRIFLFQCTHEDGSLILPQEILIILQKIRFILDTEDIGDCVPVLTHAERSAWALNRKHLQELSLHNRNILKLLESSAVINVMDENEPKNYEEVSQIALSGDTISKWADKSSILIAYKNGKFACTGEHSAYDGSISANYAFFIQLSMYENVEPDWDNHVLEKLPSFEELKFDLDDKLREEIACNINECDNKKMAIAVTHFVFDDYGKDVIKLWKIHPDSFFQVILQLAYFRLHNEVASIYETALMRHFYNGRTETLRSCTSKVYECLNVESNLKSTNREKAIAFRAAVDHHIHMMNKARSGKGFDRHLFGLWCAAFENGMDNMELFEDPLYKRSGGGGNFILSTSTLGYTVNCGFVAPMILDGYGIFYTITSDAIYIQTSVFKESIKTSAHKLNTALKETLQEYQIILNEIQDSKL